jgi:hypothetical protein
VDTEQIALATHHIDPERRVVPMRQWGKAADVNVIGPQGLAAKLCQPADLAVSSQRFKWFHGTLGARKRQLT